jgi:hypothetical protein
LIHQSWPPTANVLDLTPFPLGTIFLTCVYPSIRSTWEKVAILAETIDAERFGRLAPRRADKRADIDMMG